MIKLAKAIKAINQDAAFTFNDNDLDTIQWNEGTSPISKADILAKQAELQAEYDAQDYARKRQAAYPPTADFMEAYTEKEIGGNSTKWDAYVINYNKVRTENPK
jgi:hypothetical protein